jgi:adenosine deaminase
MIKHSYWVLALALAGCGSTSTPASPDDAGGADTLPVSDSDSDSGTPSPDAVAPDGAPCADAVQCALADEQRASDQLASVVGDATKLQAFLAAVPKGGDLHNHLSGAVYAETYLDWARTEGGFCITTSTSSLTFTCGAATTQPVPKPGDALFTTVVRAWSMQDFVASATEDGHDHFFATFGKFGAISGAAHHAKGLADVMTRADLENELYLEPMLYSNSTAGTLGTKVWTGGTLTKNDLAGLQAKLVADAGFPAAVSAITNDINATDTGARNALGCSSATPASACRVSARYMVYISRSGAQAGVFAQMVAAFEAAKAEPRLVALNLVGPEDGTSALGQYTLQMQMLDFLHTTYAGKSPLHVSLHAGELAPKYMPSGWNIATIDHIQTAVAVAHAERIGHGIDVLGESNPTATLKLLADNGVMIEIGLSSNAQILEVAGTNHPLATYLKSGVPVALATDDQAVARSSMAGEYLRAVQDQHLDYRTLKLMARTSLEKSFVEGVSLWTDFKTLTAATDCAATATGYYGDTPTPACSAFLRTSAKATLQWELERRFRAFESKI